MGVPLRSVATEPDRTGLKSAGTGPDRTGTGPESAPKSGRSGIFDVLIVKSEKNPINLSKECITNQISFCKMLLTSGVIYGANRL